MIKKRILYYIIILSIIPNFIATTNIFGQDESAETALIKKWAENSFRNGDYEFALENYLKLYMIDDKNITYNYRLSVCYIETNINKTAAIPYLEYVTSFKDINKTAYYYLGRAHMYNYSFEQAVEAFYEYKVSGVDERVMEKVNRLIEMSYYALELMNNPKNVTFERLDTSINTPFNESNPFITSDNKTIVFSSDREYVKELDENILNIYLSIDKKGYWEGANKLEVCSFDNENIVGMTSDGHHILMHIDGDYATDDIHFINKKGSKFYKEPLENLPSKLNTEDVEDGATTTFDGKTLYFSSNRAGGFGGSDIYVVKRNPDGSWGEPENLGPVINTEYDENFPSISSDGKLLHFASKGHDGIGGYDVFMTSWIDDNKVWSPPRNKGFPINTPYDNTSISFSDKKHFYVAANRKEGVGQLDIYKVTIGDEAAQPTIIQGNINIGTPQSSKPYSADYLKVFVTVFDKFGNIYGKYSVDAGSFFITIYPGEYKLEVRLDGSDKPYIENLNISDQGFISNDIFLEPVY
ncbi:MAG: PD40 domain-containing protein [Bacteroidales bacterium]|nr:PD40 domain-containing protein [Bacteroidales bacterium]